MYSFRKKIVISHHVLTLTLTKTITGELLAGKVTCYCFHGLSKLYLLYMIQVKQQVHEEMENKDVELADVRSQAQLLKDENTQMKDKVEKLEKSGRFSLSERDCNHTIVSITQNGLKKAGKEGKLCYMILCLNGLISGPYCV